MNHDLLYIISPYAGDIEKNKAFAVSCCLEHCALAWVCGPTISPGMAGEIALAERLGIPIQYVEEVPAS